MSTFETRIKNFVTTFETCIQFASNNHKQKKVGMASDQAPLPMLYISPKGNPYDETDLHFIGNMDAEAGIIKYWDSNTRKRLFRDCGLDAHQQLELENNLQETKLPYPDALFSMQTIYQDLGKGSIGYGVATLLEEFNTCVRIDESSRRFFKSQKELRDMVEDAGRSGVFSKEEFMEFVVCTDQYEAFLSVDVTRGDNCKAAVDLWWYFGERDREASERLASESETRIKKVQ